VSGRADVGATATRDKRSVDVIVWNYQDEDLPAPAADVDLEVSGLPGGATRVTEWRMDAEHSNAYAAWLKMGGPQQPSPAQVAELSKASELKILDSRAATVRQGKLGWKMTLPRQGVALVHVEW
jgi:xylan 1,4-beta-xylosidase